MLSSMCARKQCRRRCWTGDSADSRDLPKTQYYWWHYRFEGLPERAVIVFIPCRVTKEDGIKVFCL